MEALGASIVLVALAEIGDKTQLLSLYLAARYRAPLAISAGIAIATLANHGAAAWLGNFLGAWVPGDVMRWTLGAGFLAFAVWALFADTLSAPTALERRRLGVLLLTIVAFFVVEMGDKTQIATIALAARYQSILLVAAGTTLGMLIANVPVVMAGHHLADRLPVQWARRLAAGTFALAGLAILYGY